MTSALVLLLLALGILLYQNRDFWMPDTDETEDVMQGVLGDTVTVSTTPPSSAVVASVAPKTEETVSTTRRRSRGATAIAEVLPAADPPEGAFVTERTALPPLEIEVVAGETHRTVRSRNNAVSVDMDSGNSSEMVVAPASGNRDGSAVALTSDAAEKVQLSADTEAFVSRSVSPGYPVLARQMKVQGSVILQALISREGLIQDLRVLSGPPILASAAREAVMQWHFKPHYERSDAVETQAKITVNFTISTN